LRAGGASIHRSWIQRELARLFPQLGDVTFEYEWFGMIGMTSDALPRLHVHDRGVFSISGYNGRGIGPGTVMGRDLARLALGEIAIEDLALPVTDLTPARLRPAKEAFYEVGAQLAHFLGSRG
jgi:glycine/D-amino acid oxidase-like deaminating enzyme